jgi:hypothetical protein
MWKGFIVESKKYMNHPDNWNEWDAYPYKPDGWIPTSKRKASFYFWIKFPKAAMIFYFLIISNFVYNLIVKLQHKKFIDRK